MAARQPGVWGIDLGQCALKAIRLDMKDGKPVATAFEYIEHPKILSQPDADPDELIREALTQFLSRNAIRGDIIAISVPGQSGLARFVKLPPVDQKKVAEIVKFEAKQQIPFPLEEVVWDYQSLSSGEVVDGMALETEIGLFAMKRDMVNRAIRQFKEVNVEVHLVQMAPLALCNFVSYDLLGKDTSAKSDDDEDHSCIVALEIGTDSSNLVITDGGRIIWQRPIPIGGNHFTRALTKELKLTFAKAEHLKRNAAKSPELKKILSALRQVLNDFVGEVQRSLGYFTNTHRNAEIQYMIGLGNAFRLPGLQKFLQEKLQLEVRKLQELERTTGESVTAAPTFSDNIMSFAVSYGLALQGLKQARLQTNLLPYEVRLERLVRGKKPWVVTAAASLLFGLFLLAFARGMEKNAVDNDLIKKNKGELDRLVKEAKGNQDKFKKADEDLKARLRALDDIGAGTKERFNWQALHQYVNFALPQPNGEHLVAQAGLKTPKATYWTNNKDAQDAFKRWQKQQIGLANSDPVKKAEDDLFIKKNLIQLNIIGINALYSDDLGDYFRKINKDGNKLLGMHETEQNQVRDFLAELDPEKAKQASLWKDSPLFKAGKEGWDGKDGWVVEIRGYTYHNKHQDFIKDSLIENLKSPGSDPTLLKEVKDSVQARVGFLNIYKIESVPEPVAGQYVHINMSYLKTLVKGEPPPKPAVGANLPPPPPPPPGGPAAAAPTRDAWRPLGDVASFMFQDIAAAPPPPVVAPVAGKAAGPPPVPRTEFVVLFVWREPIAPPLPDADKKN